METSTETDSMSIPVKGSYLPTIRLLNANVKPLVSDIWYDLGLQLLDPEDVSTIKADKPNNASEACTAMFSLWLQKNPSATWNSLMSTLKGPGIKRHDVVRKIEQMLQPATGDAVGASTTLPVGAASSPCYTDLFESKSIWDAYTLLMSELRVLLKKVDLPALKLALASQAKAPSGIKLDKKPLSKKIWKAETNDDLLMALEQLPDCNWLNTRLLKALVNGSRLPEAENLIKAYEEFLSCKTLSEVLSQFPRSEKKEMYITKVCAKIDVNKDVTLGCLFTYCNHIEDAILNLGKGILKIKHIKKGCLEISLSTSQSSFITYKNSLHSVQKFCRIHLMSFRISTHPIIYDPWMFDLEEQSIKRKEVFHEYEVATQLCNILLENTPVDDIITVFRSHDLLMGDDLTAVTNAPSDHLKKMFLLRHLQNVSLSVWSTIYAVVNESEILKHLSDQLVKVLNQNSSVSMQFEGTATDTDNKDEQQPLVTETLHATKTMKIASLDDSVTATLPHPPLSRRSFSFNQLNCLKHLKPSTIEQVFQYTVKHVIELLSYCDPKLLIKWCENLMASDIHGIKLFTPNFMDKIKQLKSSTAILKMLSHYWTWSNYSALSTLAQFSNLAIDMLEEFGRRLNTALPIREYPVASLAVSMFPYATSSYTVLVLECDHKLDHSLQLVYDMQSIITENCHITQHALLLLAVDSNPTRLYWMIPKSVVTIVNTRVMQCSNLLFNKKVTKIFIYPNTMHVLDATKTVWPYMFFKENADDIKVLRPPTDQLHMLQHVRKQRDGWRVKAKQSKEAEEKFRTGYEKGEQKWKELNKTRSKEEQTVAKLKEKLAVCKDDLEVTVKVLSGDITNLPTVAVPMKQLVKVHSVQQLEQDLETLEQLISNLLHKTMEHREEQSKSVQQLEQKLLQKEKEIEDQKSEIEAKDSKQDDERKRTKELIKMNSDLKLQRDKLNMNLTECTDQLVECQKHLKSKDDEILAAQMENEKMRCQIVEEREKMENQLHSKERMNEELALANSNLQLDIKKMDTQLQKMLGDLTTEKSDRESIAEDNKRLKERLQEYHDINVAEKKFRDQLVKEINELRKQAIERDTQISLLYDKFISEKRENKQLEERITQLMKPDKLNQKCDLCGSEDKKVVKYSSDNFTCLALGEYHYFCLDCYKRSCYCPVHSFEETS